MKIAYFDTIAGISGDMTLGAFISAGASFEQLKSELAKLSIKNFDIQIKNVQRNGINATKVDVFIKEADTHHRHLKDIIKIIESSSLTERVKKNSINIFTELAKAEAKVHNKTIENVHFHEVGAVDAIVDIVGTSICLELMQIEKVFTSPVKIGSGGFVDTQHGKLPIPTPAVVEILKDYPCVLTDIAFELTTPTGAAIVKTLSSGVLNFEKIKIKSTGYGAGNAELQIPNILRLVVGEIDTSIYENELILIETNIDNMNPELYPYIIEKLIFSGAHDAYLVPIIMKKGRPGILLSVLTTKSELEKISNIIFSETTTLGLRIIEVGRKKIFREIKEVDTRFGKIKVKFVNADGKIRTVPEFEECKRISLETGIPVLEVYKQIEKEL